MPLDSDTSIQIGIYLGCGWSPTDIATHLGLSAPAVFNRMKRGTSKPLIEKAKAWAQVGVSKYIEARIQKAENDLADQKRRLMTKGYKVTEKLLDHGLSEDVVKPDQVHLNAAQIAIEREEGKALDRKAILEKRVNVNVQVDGGDLENVLRELAATNEMRRKALPPSPLDGE